MRAPVVTCTTAREDRHVASHAFASIVDEKTSVTMSV
jgi:hypothetical protein